MGINPVLSNICCNVYANGEKKAFLNVILSASVCEISLQNETPNIKNIPPLTIFASLNFAALLVPGHLSTALPGSIGTNIILSNLPSVIHVHAGDHLSHRLVQVIIAVIFHLVAANV